MVAERPSPAARIGGSASGGGGGGTGSGIGLPGSGSGLVEAFSQRAAVIVTDDFPAFFLPGMVRAAAAKVRVPLEAIDSNGLLPMRAADKPYPSAYAFRRFLPQQIAARDFPLHNIEGGSAC